MLCRCGIIRIVAFGELWTSEAATNITYHDVDLEGKNMWRTSVAVGTKAVGLPWDAKRILVYDVDSHNVTYSQGGDFVESNLWLTSVAIGTKVVGLPFDAGRIVVYDVDSDTVKYNWEWRLAGVGLWDTSVVIGTKVVGLPANAGRIVVYDVNSDNVTYNSDEYLAGMHMWHTSVSIGTKVVGLPWNAERIVVYDVESASVKYNTDRYLAGPHMWRTSVAVGTKVVGLPWNAEKIVLYDVESDSVNYNRDIGLAGIRMWLTSIAIGTKVVGLPCSAEKIVVYDVLSDEVHYNKEVGLAGTTMWYTSVASGTKVVGLPYNANKIVVYDLLSDSVEYHRDRHLAGTFNWCDSVAIGNKVVGLPWGANKIVVYELKVPSHIADHKDDDAPVSLIAVGVLAVFALLLCWRQRQPGVQTCMLWHACVHVCSFFSVRKTTSSGSSPISNDHTELSTSFVAKEGAGNLAAALDLKAKIFEHAGEHRQAEILRVDALARLALKVGGGPPYWALGIQQLVDFFSLHEERLETYCKEHKYDSCTHEHVCIQPCCPHDHGDAAHRHMSVNDEMLPSLDFNMHVVVALLIKPLTQVHNGVYGYASWLNKQTPLKAKVFVSHCWNESFPDFVKTLQLNVLEKHAVWICSFALPQNQNIGAVLSTDLRQSPFAQALLAAERVLIAVDLAVEPLDRSWCCFEVFLAVTNQRRVDIRAPSLSRALFQRIKEKVLYFDIRNCSASFVDDHLRIMHAIHGKEDDVNEKIQDEFVQLVDLMENVED